MARLTWDCDFTPYTHEVNDGVYTYRTVADDLSMEEVALAFIDGYDHGDDQEACTVALLTDLRTQDSTKFAFNGAGYFEWETAQEFFLA